MLRAQLQLCVLVVLVLLAGLLNDQFRVTAEIDELEKLRLCKSETCAALGLKQSFLDADMYALELIPTVSDTLAKRILDQRDLILKVADELVDDSEHSALEKIKGVGPKKAKQISSYLHFKQER